MTVPPIDHLGWILLRDCVAWVFLASASMKAWTPAGIHSTLRSLPFVPRSLAWPAAVGLVLAEAATAVLLFAGRPEGVVAAIALSTAFILAATYAIRLRLDVPCNCFGAGAGSRLSRATVLMNAALIALAVCSLPASGYASGWASALTALTGACLVLAMARLIKQNSILRESAEQVLA